MPRVHPALLALLAAFAFTLQGCALLGGGGSCSAVEFSGGTVAAGTRDNAGAVTCEDGGEPTGPDLTCNWVGVTCTAASKDGVRTCGVNYAFGVKGTGLDEWPASKKPETADSIDELSDTQFETDATDDAAFAGKATEAAGETLSKKLMKAASKAKAKAAALAAKAKEKVSAAADAAKEHGKAALDKAKAMGKDDDAKGDDAKGDDAKGDEAKERRLADDAKGGDAKGGDAKGGDAKDDAKAPAGPPEPIDTKLLKCAAPAKDDAKGDDTKSDDAKGDAKDASKLFSVRSTRSSVQTTASAGSSGWIMPLTALMALAGLSLAALKFARGSSSARSRDFDRRAHDEDTLEDAIE